MFLDPFSTTDQPQPAKKRKLTKLEKAEKANKEIPESYKEVEESRDHDRLQDKQQMSELHNMQKVEDKREKLFIGYLKDLFMQGFPKQYLALMAPIPSTNATSDAYLSGYV